MRIHVGPEKTHGPAYYDTLSLVTYAFGESTLAFLYWRIYLRPRSIKVRGRGPPNLIPHFLTIFVFAFSSPLVGF